MPSGIAPPPVKFQFAAPTKDVRSWCRDRFGNTWWDVDKSIKKERMSNARKALADESPNLPETAVVPNPLKPTYLLRMRWDHANEDSVEKRTRVDPGTCIGAGATYTTIGKREPMRSAGGVYLMGASCFDNCGWGDDEEEEETDYYVGGHPFPGDGERDSFGLVNKDDTAEMVGQTLLTYEDINELVIHDTVWFQLSDKLQEALLRDSFATEVYICDAVF